MLWATTILPEVEPYGSLFFLHHYKGVTKFVGDGGFLGGAGKKFIYEDSTGQQYLFKPGISKNGLEEPFRAYVQQAVSDLGEKIFGEDHVPVKVVPGPDGKLGTLQKIIPDVQGTLRGKNLEYLTSEQRKRIQQEHVLDWLVGNFDSHGGNFVVDKQGHVWAVDREQAYRYINDKDSARMSLDYHPNGVYHEDPPIYNELYKLHSEGKIALNFQDVLPALKQVEGISDAEFTKILTPYADALYGKGSASAARLLKQALDRKHNLRTEYENFYSKLQTVKAGKLTPFAFADSAPHAPGYVPDMMLSVDEAKKLDKKSLNAIAKAKKIPNWTLMKKDEIAQAIGDPSTAQAMAAQAKARAAAAKKAKNVASQATNSDQDVLFSEGMAKLKPGIINTSIPVDANIVEGQEARAMQYSVDGIMKTRVTMKITSDFHAKIDAALSGLSGAAIKTREFYRNDGSVPNQLNGVSSRKPPFSTGKCNEVVVDGVRILWTNKQTSYWAMRGRLDFIVDTDSGPAAEKKIQAALQKLKLEALTAPRTEEDKNVLKMSRVLWQIDPKANDSLKSADRTEANLRKMLAHYGITQKELDDVKWEEVSPGHHTYVWHGRSKEYEKSGAQYIFSGVRGDDDEQRANIVNMFNPDNPGYIALTSRIDAGIWGNDSSPSSDIEYGGGDNVFCRLVTENAIKQGGRYGASFAGDSYRLIWDTSLLERTDWYAYHGDNYGVANNSTYDNRPGALDFVKGEQSSPQSDNELMFRNGVSTSSVRCITCDNPIKKLFLVDAFQAQGIDEVNGVPIDDFIVVQPNFQKEPWK